MSKKFTNYKDWEGAKTYFQIPNEEYEQITEEERKALDTKGACETRGLNWIRPSRTSSKGYCKRSPGSANLTLDQEQLYQWLDTHPAPRYISIVTKAPRKMTKSKTTEYTPRNVQKKISVEYFKANFPRTRVSSSQPQPQPQQQQARQQQPLTRASAPARLITQPLQRRPQEAKATLTTPLPVTPSLTTAERKRRSDEAKLYTEYLQVTKPEPEPESKAELEIKRQPSLVKSFEYKDIVKPSIAAQQLQQFQQQGAPSTPRPLRTNVNIGLSTPGQFVNAYDDYQQDYTDDDDEDIYDDEDIIYEDYNDDTFYNPYDGKYYYYDGLSVTNSSQTQNRGRRF